MNSRIGIIGATGYTGSELVRLLLNHPRAKIATITSESRAGERFSDVHPQFLGLCDVELTRIEDVDHDRLELVFLALPHGVSMDYVRRFSGKHYRIIDLSGDFRLTSVQSYSDWYGQQHTFPEGIDRAVFGLPEYYRRDIREAHLVANPGCYPTASILTVAPLLIAGLIDSSSIIIDAKSGVTGAGIKPKAATHFANVNDNFTAYELSTHRHTIEIQQQLGAIGSLSTDILFTPHLLPVDRGILATTYMKPAADTEITQEIVDEAYAKSYQNEPFIRYRAEPPCIKDVRGTNLCDMHAHYDERTNTIIAIGVIDNLIKGAAGQAVQNMNIMMGWEESEGLHQVPIRP
jgi:N-acetyl-gamma-glutamyl-phosphate reductase